MNNKKYKIIFIGTPDFAVPSLVSLANDKRFDVLKVITQEDKKIGRKQIVKEPEIKLKAKELGLSVLQPSCLSCIASGILALSPDFIVVTAYGQILKKDILAIPKYACVNIHASLLPKYRGASCIQSALLNEDKKTGITIMKMDENLDTGDIILQKEITIDDSDNAGTLTAKLSNLAAELINNALVDYAESKLKVMKQDNSKSSYVGLLKKQNGQIDIENSVNKIFAQFKAMTPWPGLYLEIENKQIKLHELGRKSFQKNITVGLVNNSDKLCLNLKDGCIEVLKLQVPGKKPISAEDFLRGYAKLLSK